MGILFAAIGIGLVVGVQRYKRYRVKKEISKRIQSIRNSLFDGFKKESE